MRGSLDYYLAQPGAARIGRVVLSGGGSRLGGLVERLGAATRLPVEVAHPMSVLKIGKTGLTEEQLAYVEPMVTVPVGLALGVAVVSVLSEHQQQTAAPIGTGSSRCCRASTSCRRRSPSARASSRIQVGLGGGLLAAVAVVGGLFLDGLRQRQRRATPSSRRRPRRTRALRAETAKFADVEAVYARAAAAQAMLTQAMGDEVRFSQYMNDLSLTVPDNVWLKNVTFAQAARGRGRSARPEPGIGTVTFTGVGFSHDDVAVWLESLAKQKGYTNPYFTNSTKALLGTRSTVNFSSTVTMTAAALSGRYTTPAGG